MKAKAGNYQIIILLDCVFHDPKLLLSLHRIIKCQHQLTCLGDQQNKPKYLQTELHSFQHDQDALNFESICDKQLLEVYECMDNLATLQSYIGNEAFDPFMTR